MKVVAASLRVSFCDHWKRALQVCQNWKEFEIVKNCPIVISLRVSGNLMYSMTKKPLSCQVELRLTQVQDEETPGPSHWKRKPLEENFTQYRHKPSSSTRTLYDPSKYSNNTTTVSPRDELWPPSSSQRRENTFYGENTVLTYLFERSDQTLMRVASESCMLHFASRQGRDLSTSLYLYF